MENFSREIIDLICDEWSDDKELVMSSLYYLYHTTNDDKMKSQIVDIFNEENYCIECGNKMSLYEWSEPHTELEGSPLEYFSCYDCACCGDMDSKYLVEE